MLLMFEVVRFAVDLDIWMLNSSDINVEMISYGRKLEGSIEYI